MDDFVPVNDLDGAIIALRRSAAATPEFYRQLSQGELWFLVPYHPEVEGETLEIKGGSPLPFAVLRDENGEIAPLFSSRERLQEGLKNGRVSPRAYSAGEMPAKQVLEILGKSGLRAVINQSCATGEITIPPDLMRDLADGSALKPPPEKEEQKQARLKILSPADYPTNLIQPVFEFMRLHKNFRAAWIFLCGKIPANGYQFLFLMQPQNEAIFNDLNITVQAARSKTKDKVELGMLDEQDVDYIAKLFRQVPAFYVAADYKPPEINA
jgi:type III secretion system (T3SS) SseB-like protein